MKTLYISDLDGTLLKNDASISQRSIDIINSYIGKGGLFSVATARSSSAAKAILRDLNINLPIVEQNGAFVTNLENSEYIKVNSMDSDVAKNIFEVIKELNIDPIISTYDNGLNKLCYRGLHNEGMQWYVKEKKALNDSRLTYVENLESVFSEATISFVVFVKESDSVLLNKLKQTVSDEVIMESSKHNYCIGYNEVILRGPDASKTVGIKAIVDYLGLSNAEIVVFGDNINDLDMFESAHKAIAVKNAVPSVLDKAHKIVGSNEDDGVANYIMTEEKLSFMD